jgi:hypothetical protein
MLEESDIQEIEMNTTKLVSNLLESYAREHQVRIEKQDQLMEQFERQLAALTSGYAELASLVEALLSMVVNTSPEKMEEFYTHLRSSREQMLDTLRYATQSAAGSEDKFVAYGAEPATGSASSEES